MTHINVRKPICDQPDFAALAGCATAREAWSLYRTTATEPYEFNSFVVHYYRWRANDKRNGGLSRTSSEDERLSGAVPKAEEFVASETFWRARAPMNPAVLSLRCGASLRVASGSLEIVEKLPLHLAPDGESHVTRIEAHEARRGKRREFGSLKAIVLPEHGWHVTAEAVKFCLAHDIALVSVAGRTGQGEKGLISVIGGNPQADATLLWAQSAAEPVKVAREIVRQTIETRAWSGGLGEREARERLAALDKARTIDRVMYIEGRAAAAYWQNASERCEVKSVSPRWPRYWALFPGRYSPIGQTGPRHADHPVNALLNWSYAVVAGRLAAELFARGACLAIGYLHSDKPGRYSLAYDALELLRPLIDEKVFAFVAKTRFRMGDFEVAPSGQYKGEVRVGQELLKAFAPATFISGDEIAKAADWMIETIVGSVRAS